MDWNMEYCEYCSGPPCVKFETKCKSSSAFLCIKCYKPKLTKNEKVKKFTFITIQDFQRRMCDIDKFVKFVNSISYMYEAGKWIIESGKNLDKDEYNLHLHMLVKIRDNVKNHKKVLNIKWMRQFNTNLYDSDYYLMKQHRDVKGMCSYDDWITEKLEYFDNSKKGDHKNTEDLGLNGEFS